MCVLTAWCWLTVALASLALAAGSCVTHLQAKPALLADKSEQLALDTVTMCTGMLSSVPFTVLNSTTVLKLASNDFRYVHEDSFRRFVWLEQIDLSNNRLASISVFGFQNDRLVNLTLRSNEITELPRGLFNVSVRLVALDLSSNRLEVIDGSLFSPLVLLESLDLSNNRISKLPPDAFRHNVRLTELQLARNALVTLDESMERNLPASLIRWSLAYNAWHCDCHLLWLKTLLQRSNAEYDRAELRCRSGAVAHAADQLWVSLRYNSFACAPSLFYPASSTKTHLTQPSGSSVVLTCRAYSFVRVDVTWYKDWLSNWTVTDNLVADAKHETWRTGTNNLTTTFTVRNLEVSDAGSYFCLISNEAGFVVGNYSVAVSVTSAHNASAVTSLSGSPFHVLATVSGLFVLAVLIVTALACSAYLRKERRKKQAGASTANGKSSHLESNGTAETQYDQVLQGDEKLDGTVLLASGARSSLTNGQCHAAKLATRSNSNAASVTDGSRFLAAFGHSDFQDPQMPSPCTIRSSARTVTFRIDVDENCPLHGHAVHQDGDDVCDAAWDDGDHYCPVHSPIGSAATLIADGKFSSARNGLRPSHHCPVHGEDVIREHHV